MSDHGFDAPELSDEQLDELLCAAGEDLLAHVRAVGDPTRGLLALMGQSAAPPTEPDSPAHQAAVIIIARVRTEDFLAILGRALPTIRSYARLAAVPRQVEFIEKAGEQAAVIVEALEARDLARARDLACALERDFDHDLDLGRYVSRNVGRDLSRFVGRDLGRHVGRDLSPGREYGRYGRDPDPERARAHDRAATLAGALARARDRARDLARDVNHALDSDLDRYLACARALGGDLERYLAVARSLDSAQAHDLSLNFASDLQTAALLVPDAVVLRTCGLDPALIPVLGPDWDPLAEDLLAVERLVQALQSALTAIRVDASGADLSGLDLGDCGLHALEGVVWTANTRWPDDLRAFVEGNSRQITDGVYQITSGTAPGNTCIAVLK